MYGWVDDGRMEEWVDNWRKSHGVQVSHDVFTNRDLSTNTDEK